MLASAATYSASDADSFKAAWDTAVSGDSITLTGDVDLSMLSTTLADKTGSINVQAAPGKALTWSSNAGQTTLPSGMTLSDITIINAPGTLSASGVVFGENVSFLQSQGQDSLLVAEAGESMTISSGTTFSHIASNTDGGVLEVKNNASVLVQGGVSFDSCASEGLGGAIYVHAQDSADPFALVLQADTSKGNITFTGNQSEASEESGLYTGFPNDVYLGANAAMKLDAAENSIISLNGGVESDDATARIVKTGAGETLLGDGSYYSGKLTINEGTVKLAGDTTWGDGSALVEVNTGSMLSLADAAAIDGAVSLSGKLAAEGTSSVSGVTTVQDTSAELEVSKSLSLNGGLAGDAAAEFSKTGAGSLLLADSAAFAGSLKVKNGALALKENASLGTATSKLSLDTNTTLRLNSGAAVQSELAMNAAVLECRGAASLLSPKLTLSGANNWTFFMTNDTLQSTTHRLQLNPATTLTRAEGGSLTLHLDMSGVTSTGNADKIYLINTTALTDDAVRDLLGSANVTLTDRAGTHATNAALDIATGTIDLSSLSIRFDRPGVSIANALHSSVGALQTFTAQSMQHMGSTATTPAEGTNVWAAGIGYFDRYSGSWDYSGGGYAVGVSRSVSRNTVLGISVGQMMGNNKAKLNSVDSDSEATIKQNEIMLAIQASHAFQTVGGGTPVLDLTGGFGITDNTYKSGSHKGSWDDKNFCAAARLSWHWMNERENTVAPFIGLEYLSGQQNGATISGPTGSWRSEGADLRTLVLPVGVSMYSHMDIGDGLVLTPKLELSYRADLTKADPSTQCTDGTARWLSKGESRSRSAFEMNAAAHLQITPQWSTWAAYRYEIRSGQSNHTISAGVSYSF